MATNYVETDWGLEQSKVYHNRDRYDEEINEAEISGTFSAINATQSMASVAVLLIGDRNAGKTTLLHSLADEQTSLTFLRLQSLVPSILSTFRNCRFCNVEAAKKKGLNPLLICSDEGNFLDSDIARASVTLCKSDWLFLLEEMGVQNVPIEYRNSDLTRLSLIEFGGDHLDRLENKGVDRSLFENERVVEICNNSRKLLQCRNLTSVAYFVNGATATAVTGDGPLRLDVVYAQALRSRLANLRQWCPYLTAIQVYVTRLPVVAAGQMSEDLTAHDTRYFDVLASVIGRDEADYFELKIRRQASSPLFREIETAVKCVCSEVLPHVKCTVSPLSLLTEDHRPDPCSIYLFLASTVESALSLHRLGANTSDPELLMDLIQCIKNCRYYTSTRGEKWLETLTWIDSHSIAQGYERDVTQQKALPLSVLLPHAQRLLKTLSGCYGGCLPGVCTVPKLKIECQDNIMLRLLQNLRVFERCPDRIHIQVEVTYTGVTPFTIDFSPVSAPHMDISYRFPMLGSLCHTILQVLEASAETRHDNVDWDKVSDCFLQLNETRVVDALVIPQPLTNTSVCDFVEPLINTILDVYTVLVSRKTNMKWRHVFTSENVAVTMTIEDSKMLIEVGTS